jgi:DNA polymerase III subunit delta'
MALSIYPWHQSVWRDILQRKSALPHALLFRGREGTGKLDFVRALAQSVSCDTPGADGAACGGCLNCRWFSAGNHPDYREVLPEILRADGGERAEADGRKPRQEITIDEIRELSDFIHLTANQRNGKTIVIYPAERLNVNAANALLKNLEEPPPSTRFMLVTHRPSYLPATIISRCQQVVLPTPSAEVAEPWLRAQGLAEPALSLAQTANAPLAALALVDGEFWSQRKVLLGALATPKVDALALAEQIRDFPLERLLGWMQRWIYDLMRARSVGSVRYNPDFAQVLLRMAGTLRAVEIARYYRLLVAQQRSIHHPLNPRLFIEQLLLTYVAMLRGEPVEEYYAA